MAPERGEKRVETREEPSNNPTAAPSRTSADEALVHGDLRGTAGDESALIAQACEVFDYWRARAGLADTTVFSPLRRTAVLGRLREGCPPERLKRAVDGCLASGWHRERGRIDLAHICADASRVDDFVRRTESAPRRAPDGLPVRAAAPVPQMPATEAGRMWRGLLEALEADGARYAAETLGGVKAVELEGGVLTARWPDVHQARWAEDHYREFVEQHLGEGGPQVRFVGEGAQP